MILAGGFSSRMHQNKAELRMHGKTLLELQVEKMRRLGVTDIIISGYENVPEGTRYAADIYPHRGPLSGIHAGLLEAKEEKCYVLSVDAPLVPEEYLKLLAEHHKQGACVAKVEGFIEPLIGVYAKNMAPIAEALLQGEDTSVKALFKAAGMTSVEYTGDSFLLKNCNTPEEYQRMLTYTEKK